MHSRLRIAFLAPGSDVHTQRWVEAMVGRGHAVLLITPDPMPSTDAEIFDPFSAMGGWARVPKLRAIIAERLILRRLRAFAPDLVHLHWLNPTLGTLRIARRVQAPEPPSACRRSQARWRRAARRPPQTNGVGAWFQPRTVAASQSSTVHTPRRSSAW